MSNTYYDSQLTAAEIEAALEAIDGVITPANNGKVLAIENGGIVAKDVSEYTEQPVLVSKNITANGNYDPATDDADGYDSVSVNVPNSYAAGDEGKVVSNGALVAQTARSSQITENGTYDTTLNDEVTVNVAGGGSAVIEPLSVTQNGTYTAPSGVDGYSPVTVNVSGGGDKNILTGTSAPTSQQGRNGDMYLLTSGGGVEPPSGYSLRDYLAVGSTRGPYIDTGLLSTRDTYCEIMYQYTSTPSGNTWFFGAFQNVGIILGFQNGNTEGYLSNSGGNLVAYDTQRHIVEIKSDGIYLDGEKKQTGNWSGVPLNVPIYLFGRGGDNPVINHTRIYYCKIWVGNTLTRLFVPAVRSSDSEPGMYDFVTDTFYTNDGSGSFEAGTGPSIIENGTIQSAFLKENGAWHGLIESNIDDVNLGPTFISKSITADGTYRSVDDNADGYSEVVVNVSGGRPEQEIAFHYQWLYSVGNAGVVMIQKSTDAVYAVIGGASSTQIKTLTGDLISIDYDIHNTGALVVEALDDIELTVYTVNKNSAGYNESQPLTAEQYTMSTNDTQSFANLGYYGARYFIATKV